LPRRLAIAALLATTTIFPSLRASRLFVIASQPAFRHCEPAGEAISQAVIPELNEIRYRESI